MPASGWLADDQLRPAGLSLLDDNPRQRDQEPRHVVGGAHLITHRPRQPPGCISKQRHGFLIVVCACARQRRLLLPPNVPATAMRRLETAAASARVGGVDSRRGYPRLPP